MLHHAKVGAQGEKGGGIRHDQFAQEQPFGPEFRKYAEVEL